MQAQDPEGLLLPAAPLHDDDLALRQVLRPQLDTEGDALRLPMVELLPWPHVPVVEVDAKMGQQTVVDLERGAADLLLAALLEDRDDDDLDRRHLWGEDEALLVPVDGDDGTDE